MKSTNSAAAVGSYLSQVAGPAFPAFPAGEPKCRRPSTPGHQHYTAIKLTSSVYGRDQSLFINKTDLDDDVTYFVSPDGGLVKMFVAL